MESTFKATLKLETDLGSQREYKFNSELIIEGNQYIPKGYSLPQNGPDANGDFNIIVKLQDIGARQPAPVLHAFSFICNSLEGARIIVTATNGSNTVAIGTGDQRDD